MRLVAELYYVRYVQFSITIKEQKRDKQSKGLPRTTDIYFVKTIIDMIIDFIETTFCTFK